MADGAQDAAVENCRAVIEPDETFLEGWSVISINQWDFEQPRVLLLSSAALYRVKYNFADGEIKHHERQPLEDIMRIQCGPFYHHKFTLAGMLTPDAEGAAGYGLRVFSEQWRSASVFSKEQQFRTYRSVTDDLAETKRVAAEIAGALADAYANAVGRNVMLDEFEIKRNNLLGPISVVKNKFR
eukprot:c45574_g1_i1.p1 GENE.c45574_g1_i1~~c45574_g1_i1.p1  ORF type:complete len:192 (+),score=31.79 c45574_g1_i1:26-577(+)